MKHKFDYSESDKAQSTLTAVKTESSEHQETFGNAASFAKIIAMPLIAYFIFTAKHHLNFAEIPDIQSSWFTHVYQLDKSFFMQVLCFFQVVFGLGAGLGILYLIDKLIAFEEKRNLF